MSGFDGQDEELDLGNDDTLSERLESVDLEAVETCSTEKVRERLDL